MVLSFILTLFSVNVLCSDQIYTGEKDLGAFYGTTNPIPSYFSYDRKFEFLESTQNKNYLNLFISQDLSLLENFLLKDLKSSLQCSREDLNKIYDDYVYAHRLISLSYLFEAIEDYNFTLKKLDSKTCKTNWKKIILSCNPKTEDMSIFLENLVAYLPNIKKKVLPANFSIHSYKSQWRRKSVKSRDIDLAHFLLSKAKRTLSSSEVLSICEETKSKFKSICSETDSLWGMSSVMETYPLIAKSNLLNIYDNKKVAISCLRSFKNVTKHKEIKDNQTELIFSFLYQKMKDKSSYAQGRIFPLGALKEFREKGVKTIFKKPQKKKIVKVIAPKVVVKTKKHIVKKIKPKLMAKIVRQLEAPKEKEKAKVKKPTKSYFYRRYKNLGSRQGELALDMDEFKYDFVFTLSIKDALDRAMNPFISRKGIQDMKDSGGLGGKETAIPLILLKYMIETSKHQSLFALTQVIGDTFFVQNDIDSLKEAQIVKVRLSNTKDTDFKWLITLINES